MESSFTAELQDLYYGVDDWLRQLRLWCLANPERCPTKRGAKRFVVNCLAKAKRNGNIQIKPLPVARKPIEVSEPVQPLADRQAALQRLRAVLK